MNENERNRKAFYELDLWKHARQLRNDALKIILLFPPDEKYGLTDQVKSAARSIAACIAEGHGRFTYKDQVHFCIMSRGSATELLNHLIDAYDQGYITKEILLIQQSRVQEILRMLNGYIAYLRKQQ